MHLFSIIRSIFVEDDGEEEVVFHPEDLTDHYTKELGKLFLDEVYIATRYSAIESRLERYKFHSHREEKDVFVDLLSKCVEKYHLSALENTTIVPVPMHWSRYLNRGFDHTKYLAKYLSKFVDIPYHPLLRALWSKHQSHLSREKRLENKKNRFRIESHFSLPKTVILLDDVISSGATANECAKILKSAWVEKIIGLFLASNI